MTRTLRAFGASLLCGVVVLAGAGGAAAQEKSTQQAPASFKVPYDFSVTPMYQFNSKLNGGGDYSVSRYFLAFNTATPLSRQMLLGLGFSFNWQDFHFNGTPAFTGVQPWHQVEQIGFSPSFIYAASNKWTYVVGPQFEWSRETGANWSDALVYGLTFAATRTMSSTLTLGIGVGVFSRLKETTYFPALLINWRISDHWRLTNPFRAGPAGPGGLELVYTPDAKWEFGGGAAYRSFRFRLDNNGPFPDGIGQTNYIPVYGRAAYKFGPRFRLDFYAGALLDGQLRVENSDGNLIASDNTQTAPFVALTLAAHF
jgi:hypothetical protein